jgi:hypothetical protein
MCMFAHYYVGSSWIRACEKVVELRGEQFHICVVPRAERAALVDTGAAVAVGARPVALQGQERVLRQRPHPGTPTKQKITICFKK